MFGITTADAIALGSMIAALTAACMGLVRGDQARTEGRADAGPPPGRSVQSDVGDLAEAMRDLVDVLRALAAVGATRDHWAETMRDIIERIDRRPS